MSEIELVKRLPGGELYLSESPEIRWFEAFPKCSCGKTANGLLRGTQNQSFGYHCSRCAEKRIKASEKVRAALRKVRP